MSGRRIALLVGAAAILLGAAWVGYQVWQVSRDLTAASDDARTLQQALTDGEDGAVVDSRLQSLQDRADAANDRTRGRTWGLLTKMPVFGDDARAVRLVSATIADLSDSGIESLVESATDLRSFLPEGGRIPLDKLTQLQEPVATADAAFASADEALEAEDPTNFVGPLRSKYRELTGQVSDASRALSSAHKAVDLMPGMLGAEGPRDYLLVFQNNAEIRATGGLPGAVSLLHVQDGALTLTKQVAGAAFGETDEPVLPLTDAEQEIYGEQLGTYFLDANFTPDFPRASALWQARWEQEYGDQTDGVIALDPVALSYLLPATGPIQVGDVSLTADNVVDELLHQTYLRFPDDPPAQDAYFRDVATVVFQSFTTGGADPRLLLEGLQRGVDEGRIALFSENDSEEAVIAGTALSRSLTSADPTRPEVAVALNDTTGAKMSYFLRFDVSLDSTSCRSGDVQTLSGDAHVVSVAPTDAASLPASVTGGGAFGIQSGSQLVTMRLYGPVGGSIKDVTVNSEPQDVSAVVEQDGRPVFTTYLFLDPQMSADVEWVMESGPGQFGAPRLQLTPGLNSPQEPTSVASPCST